MKFLFLILTLSLLTVSLNGNYSETISEPWGVDCELANRTRGEVSEKARPVSRKQKVCLALIRFYQSYISPIDGPRSSYYPTSSQYALEAIETYGILRGISLGCDRLLRENGESWVYERTDKYGMERKLDPVR